MKKYLYLVAVIVLCAAACKKNSYYQDSGKANPNFNGTMLDYLHSKPDQFDSISKIITLAGMEEAFKTEKLTFFALSDSGIATTVQVINQVIGNLGLAPINRLDQIDGSVWRKYLSLYLFKGEKSLNDYKQVDWSNFSAFGGQTYPSYDGYPMHIGVEYTSANGIQYAGYRVLELSYIGSQANPKDLTSWSRVWVASTNIHPTNGYVHVLRYTAAFSGYNGTLLFGFNIYQLTLDAIKAGIKY